MILTTWSGKCLDQRYTRQYTRAGAYSIMAYALKKKALMMKAAPQKA
jgi:hypothetical protein